MRTDFFLPYPNSIPPSHDPTWTNAGPELTSRMCDKGREGEGLNFFFLREEEEDNDDDGVDGGGDHDASSLAS